MCFTVIFIKYRHIHGTLYIGLYTYFTLRLCSLYRFSLVLPYHMELTYLTFSLFLLHRKLLYRQAYSGFALPYGVICTHVYPTYRLFLLYSYFLVLSCHMELYIHILHSGYFCCIGPTATPCFCPVIWSYNYNNLKDTLHSS